MWCRRWLLVPLVLVLLTQPAVAGFIFRKIKPDPAVRVPELLQILKSDPDERKRIDAAIDLKQFDPQNFPQIMPALIDALQHDESYTVRAEAAETIGKLRPVSQQAGYALEQANLNDKTLRVRMAARSALWQYHLHGYRSAKPTEEAKDHSKEPPLAAPKQPTPPPRPMPPTMFRPGETTEPPLAPGVGPTLETPPPLAAPSSVGRPLPPQPVPATPPPFPKGYAPSPLPTPTPAMKPLPTLPTAVPAKPAEGPMLNFPE